MTQYDTPENVTDPNSSPNGNPPPVKGKGVPLEQPNLNPDVKDDTSQPSQDTTMDADKNKSKGRK